VISGRCEKNVQHVRNSIEYRFSLAEWYTKKMPLKKYSWFFPEIGGGELHGDFPNMCSTDATSRILTAYEKVLPLGPISFLSAMF